MQRTPGILIASVLLAASLPVTVRAYGFADEPGDWSYRPYAGSAAGYYTSGSLHLQTAMNGDGYYVRAYMEGLNPDDMQVVVRGNRLVLQTTQGNRYWQYGPEARGAAQWQMRFRRQLRLPYDADWTRMTTNINNGIMEIYIPRRSQYRPPEPYLEPQGHSE